MALNGIWFPSEVSHGHELAPHSLRTNPPPPPSTTLATRFSGVFDPGSCPAPLQKAALRRDRKARLGRGKDLHDLALEAALAAVCERLLAGVDTGRRGGAT